MKPKFDKISIFSMLFISFLISIPVFLALYSPALKNKDFFADAGRGQVIPEFQEDSRILDKRILLRKDKSITLNKSKLIYKGMKDDKIHLDLYLLELDPEAAYPQYISQAEARKGIRLGDSTFQLLKVSNKTLQLKIVDLFQS